MIYAQAPQDPAPTLNLIEQLQALGWVDRTALAVLLAFFVLGLFKGLIWQVSRIGILVAAYVVAGRFGHDVAGLLANSPAVGSTATGTGAGEAAPPAPETTLYLAYVLLFVLVLIVLSLVAMLVKKLADKAGLGFFDRLGGGLVGVATGACVVLALVFVVNMFFRDSELARAAESSHSQRLSRRAIDWLGNAVNDDLRSVLALVPLRSGATTAPGNAADPNRSLDPGIRNGGLEPPMPGQQPAPTQPPERTGGSLPPAVPPASPAPQRPGGVR